MNWQLWLLSGFKVALYYVIATVLTVILGAISYTLGYKPTGEAAILTWQVITGMLVAVQGWIKNYLQHKDDKAV